MTTNRHAMHVSLGQLHETCMWDCKALSKKVVQELPADLHRGITTCMHVKFTARVDPSVHRLWLNEKIVNVYFDLRLEYEYVRVDPHKNTNLSLLDKVAYCVNLFLSGKMIDMIGQESNKYAALNSTTSPPKQWVAANKKRSHFPE